MAKTKQEIKYNIIKKGSNVLIEKTGMVESFSLEELDDVIKYNEKLKTECESNLKIREAERENIINHYEKIKDLSEEEIFRIAMYYQKDKDIKEYKSKLSEIYKKITEQNNIKKLVLLKKGIWTKK